LTESSRNLAQDGPPTDGRLEDSRLLALEGGFLVERAVAAGLSVEELRCVPARADWARSLGLEPLVMAEAEISKHAGYPFHRGILALARRPAQRAPADIVPPGDGSAIVLVLPEIGDPENLGSCFRSAAALGASAVLLGPQGPDPLSRRALRVSMGSTLTLPWARLSMPSELGMLAEKGFLTAACVLDPGAIDVRDWKAPGRTALVMGNEAFGLSDPWLSACGARITIEMLGGTDSLNVATAAAVFLYELAARARRGRTAEL
jgi:tRNA G18 (ribose-2'-O)-methylase SpoU